MKPRVLVPVILALVAVCLAIWWLARGGLQIGAAGDRVGEPSSARVAGDPAPTPALAPPAPAAPAAGRPGSAAAPPAAPDSPPPSSGRGAPAGDPAVIERALASHTQPQLALMGELARAGVTLPPALDQLFERQRRGDSPEQLRRFVRARFPADMKLRLLTVRWINRQDPSRTQPDARLFRPSEKPLPSVGSIERVENPAPPRP